MGINFVFLQAIIGVPGDVFDPGLALQAPKFADSFPLLGTLGFFIDIFLPASTMALGSSQPLI